MLSVFVIIVTFAASFLLTRVVRRLAISYGVVDHPTGGRKHHRQPIPLLGGVGVWAALWIGIALLWPTLFPSALLPKYFIGMAIASFILVVGGALDDRYNLPPYVQFVFPLLATCCIIGAGIGIDFITNPLGGLIRFDHWQVEVLRWHGVPYTLTIIADLFTVVWLLGMMYTTKFLDGLDGLVSGISVIASIVIALVSFFPPVNQPELGLVALIVGAAYGGFLPWNWHPAKMFLGESGSLLAGFFIGVLAILSGGKIATSLLIFGIPLLDAAWVICSRLRQRVSPFRADRRHLHLRLIDSGFSQRQVVVFLWTLTALFGLCSLFLQTQGKVIVFGVLGLTVVLIGIMLVSLQRRGKP